MKLVTADLVGFIKQRHFTQVRGLKPVPALAIIMAGDNGSSQSFVRAKQRYGTDIGVEVRVVTVANESELRQSVSDCGKDTAVAGIVVQLPLPDGYNTEDIIDLIPATKDVDALRSGSPFEPPTAKGIIWLLGSLGLASKDLTIAVVGQGRLVGAPISDMLEASGATVTRCDINTPDIQPAIKAADIVITAVGKPGLITREMLKPNAIVVDAGTAEAAGSLAGDVSLALYDDPDVRVTPVPGGVGPMTVAALFDNLLIAASQS